MAFPPAPPLVDLWSPKALLCPRKASEGAVGIHRFQAVLDSAASRASNPTRKPEVAPRHLALARTPPMTDAELAGCARQFASSSRCGDSHRNKDLPNASGEAMQRITNDAATYVQSTPPQLGRSMAPGNSTTRRRQTLRPGALSRGGSITRETVPHELYHSTGESPTESKNMNAYRSYALYRARTCDEVPSSAFYSHKAPAHWGRRLNAPRRHGADHRARIAGMASSFSVGQMPASPVGTEKDLMGISFNSTNSNWSFP